MAIYNNGFPYQIYPGLNQYQQPQYQQPQYQQPQQIQNGGFIPVASEMDARNYPVAPGNSVTFKDEKMPYVYVKTMGFSQLDRPIFEKFRLVKEQDAQMTQENGIETDLTKANDKIPTYDAKSEIEALQKELEAYKANMDTLETDIEDLREKIADFFKKPESSRRKTT